MVAPSRSSNRQAKTAATIRQSFGKVSKPSVQSKSNKAIEVADGPASRSVGATTERKRKRDRDEQCNNEHPETTRKLRKVLEPKSASQASRVHRNAQRNLSSRSGSTPTQCDKEEVELQVPELPDSLEILISLHNAFIKAMSIHFAHNGLSSPAMLTNLLESITRLWKRRQVQKQDIRKMLALQELHPGYQSPIIANTVVEHKLGNFMLLQSGLGIQHLLVEYVGNSQSTTSFNEQLLQSEYLRHVNDIWNRSQYDEPTLRMLQQYDDIPQLSIKLGAQKAAINEKAQLLRRSILTPNKQAAISASLDAPNPQTEPTTSQSTPSRSQSLLDRILNKQQLALAAGPKPTAEELAIHRAKCRLPELADILLMLQKQRTRNLAISRISFQYMQLVQYIKDSTRIPISEEEIRMGLKVLAGDVANEWVQLHGSVIRDEERTEEQQAMAFVVLTGRGLSGAEVRERLGRM